MQNSLIGGLYVILLFFISFAAVYITKAAYLLITVIKPTGRSKDCDESQNERQKIYYIVERKRKPVRRTKSEPRQIFFSENKEA